MSGTLIVRFVDGLNESEVRKLLEEYQLTGTKVSTFINKYAIEVPFGREEYYINLLESIWGIKSAKK